LPDNKEAWAFDSATIIKEDELDKKYKKAKHSSSGNL